VEVFWVDVSKLEIPSDYYYLVARGPAIGSLAENKRCRTAREQILVDHPPDFSGRRFSRADYVASGTGTCEAGRESTRWAYVVAAPGFGPIRHVGIHNSGLYVVMAAVSGSQSELLLRRIVKAARFGDTPIGRIVQAGRAPQ
jgi:hypothetical protein